MPTNPTILGPYPDKSPITDKGFKILTDWLKWFQDLSYFVRRIINHYDIRSSGVATLVAGTVFVSNTNVTTTCCIRCTPFNRVSSDTFNAAVCPCAFVVGVGFTLISETPDDTREVFYEIVEGF